MKQKSFTPPVAVERAYDLWLWLEGRVTDFPTSAKHQMGRRILDATVDVMDLLLRATFSAQRSPERGRALTAANQRVALLRLLLRGARERRHLSVDQHEHGATRLAETRRRICAGPTATGTILRSATMKWVFAVRTEGTPVAGGLRLSGLCPPCPRPGAT